MFYELVAFGAHKRVITEFIGRNNKERMPLRLWPAYLIERHASLIGVTTWNRMDRSIYEYCDLTDKEIQEQEKKLGA
jgi:hypothetical protein